MTRPKVYSLAIESTPHCQQKCGYCYNAWRDDNGRSMETSGALLLARVRRLLDAWDLDHVTITGGEPFTRKDIFDIIGAVRARGTRVQMISNGGLVTEEVARRLAELSIDYVQVTLNGPTRAMHEEHVGEGHWDRTLVGIERLVRHGVPVVGCVVVTRKNASVVGETIDLFKKLGAYHIALSRFSPAGYAAASVATLLPSLEDVVVALTQARPYAEAGLQVSCTMPVPPCMLEQADFAPIGFGACAIGTSSQELALGPDGRLRNCTLHQSALAALDVIDPAFDPVAVLAEAEAYKSVVPEFCRGCLHEHTCGGGCGAAAEWVYGTRNVPDPFLWQHVDGDRAGKRRLEVLA